MRCISVMMLWLMAMTSTAQEVGKPFTLPTNDYVEKSTAIIEGRIYTMYQVLYNPKEGMIAATYYCSGDILIGEIMVYTDETMSLYRNLFDAMSVTVKQGTAKVFGDGVVYNDIRYFTIWHNSPHTYVEVWYMPYFHDK